MAIIFTADARPKFHPSKGNKCVRGPLFTGNIDIGCAMMSNLAFLPLPRDPKELPLENFLLPSLAQDKVRKCPNSQSNGGSGTTGNTTGACGGARPHFGNPFSFTSPKGVGGGQGNGDDEDDDQITDYKKKWLGCDGYKKRNSVDKTKWGPFKNFQKDKGEVTGYRLDGSRERSKAGRDECDASMAEQALLLQKQWTSQQCSSDQVVYTTLHGSIVAFIQRLFGLWTEGSFITPGLSEGIIYNRNLTLNSQDQYRFGEEFVPFAELGHGDFGTTFACQDWRSGMKIATKEIPRERFLPFEVLLLAKLRSPFIVRFLGATAERSALYLHMELVDNALSLEYLAGEGSLLMAGQDRIVNIGFQLLAALDCLLSCNVLHRDLTCRNVLLTVADKVKVIDLNLAVPAPYEQTTMPVGDIHYLAPEVTDGVKMLTCSSDMWSCGIILISLLRGVPQDDDCERMAITDYHPLHCGHLSHCHPALRDLLQLMLTPDPSLRPPPKDLVKHLVFTSEDLLEELEACPARVDSDSPDRGGAEGDDIADMFQELYLRDGRLLSSPPDDHPPLEGLRGAATHTLPCKLPPGQYRDVLASQEGGPPDIDRDALSSDLRAAVTVPLSLNPPTAASVVRHSDLATPGCTGDHAAISIGKDISSNDPHMTGAPLDPGEVEPLSEQGGSPLSGVDRRTQTRDVSDCRMEGILTSQRSRKDRRLKSHRVVKLATSFSANDPARGTGAPSPQQKRVDKVSLRDSSCQNSPGCEGAPGNQEVLGAGAAASTHMTSDMPFKTKASLGDVINHRPLAEVDRGMSEATCGRDAIDESSLGANRACQMSDADPGDMTGCNEPHTAAAVGGLSASGFDFESAPQDSLERDLADLEMWNSLKPSRCVPPPRERYTARGPNAEPTEGGRLEDPEGGDCEPMESIVSSQGLDSYSARQNLCDGPYQYPEEWLHSGGAAQLSTVEAAETKRNQGGDASGDLLRSSSHESSFRGAQQDEATLANEILRDHLSLDTDPELQDKLYQQFTSGSSAEPSLT